MFHIIYYYHFNAADGVAPQRSTHSRGGGFVFSAALKTLQARMVIVPARFEDRNNIDALNALDEEIPTCTHPRPSALSRACRVGSSALTCVEIVPGPLGVALNLKKYPNLKHVVNTGEQFYRGESPPPPNHPHTPLVGLATLDASAHSPARRVVGRVACHVALHCVSAAGHTMWRDLMVYNPTPSNLPAAGSVSPSEAVLGYLSGGQVPQLITTPPPGGGCGRTHRLTRCVCCVCCACCACVVSSGHQTAMFSHSAVVNSGALFGSVVGLTSSDRICVASPLHTGHGLQASNAPHHRVSCVVCVVS